MRQRSIEIEGLGHGATPIPAACRVGPVLATGGIGGRDPASGILPADAAQQAQNCFANLGRILAAAGMDLGDVVKITVFLADEAHRAAVNPPWLECWPEPHHRPARHALVMPLRGGMLLQLEALAVAKDA